MFNLPWLFDRFCLDWPRSRNVDFLLALATLFSLCFSIDRFHTGLDIFHLVPFLSPTPHCPRTPCTTTVPTKNKLVCQCTDRQRKKTTTKRTNKQTNDHHQTSQTKPPPQPQPPPKPPPTNKIKNHPNTPPRTTQTRSPHRWRRQCCGGCRN